MDEPNMMESSNSFFEDEDSMVSETVSSQNENQDSNSNFQPKDKTSKN